MSVNRSLSWSLGLNLARNAVGLGLALPFFLACGLLNAGGIPHPLYAEEAGFCRYCTEQGEVCASFGTQGQCVALDTLTECSAAIGFFATREEEGPWLAKVEGKTVDNAARHRCLGDEQVPVTLFVALVDLEDDVAFGVSYVAGEGPFDLSEDAQLLDAEGRGAKPVAWDTDVVLSSAREPLYEIGLRFCLDAPIDEPVAVQLLDERGNHSNPLCLSPP